MNLTSWYMGVPKPEPEKKEKEDEAFPSFEEWYKPMGLLDFGIYAGFVSWLGPLGIIPGFIANYSLHELKNYLKGVQTSWVDLGLNVTQNETGGYETEVTTTRGMDPITYGKNFAETNVKMPGDIWKQIVNGPASAYASLKPNFSSKC